MFLPPLHSHVPLLQAFLFQSQHREHSDLVKYTSQIMSCFCSNPSTFPNLIILIAQVFSMTWLSRFSMTWLSHTHRMWLPVTFPTGSIGLPFALTRQPQWHPRFLKTESIFCFKIFAFALPSTWNAPPPYFHRVSSLTTSGLYSDRGLVGT